MVPRYAGDDPDRACPCPAPVLPLFLAPDLRALLLRCDPAPALALALAPPEVCDLLWPLEDWPVRFGGANCCDPAPHVP